MSSNESNGTALIQDGVEYKIELGESFLSPQESGYYSLQFSFIPESVDFSKQAVLRRNSDRHINIQYQTSQGEPKYFDGTYDESAKNECILVFDSETGTMRLEQIQCSTASTLKSTPHSTIAAPTSSTQGTLVQPNNPYNNSAGSSPTAGATPVTPDSSAKKAAGGVRIKLRVPGAHGADGKNPITPPGGTEPTTPQSVQTPPGTVSSHSSVSPPEASTANKKKETAPAPKPKGRGAKTKQPVAHPKRGGKTLSSYGRGKKKSNEDAELEDFAKLLGDELENSHSNGSSDNDVAHVDNNFNGNNENGSANHDSELTAGDIMSFDYIPPPEPSQGSSTNNGNDHHMEDISSQPLQSADPMDVLDPLDFGSQPGNTATQAINTAAMMNDDDSSDSDSSSSDSSDSSDSDS